MVDLRAGSIGKRQLKLPTGTRKRRHDGANRDRSNGSDFLVRTPLQFAQHDQLSKTWRQGLQSPRKVLAIVTCDSKHFGCRASEPLQIFIKLSQVFHATILFHPGVTAVPHALHPPSAPISASKTIE